VESEKVERMADVSRFEDLIAWQKARVLTRRIYEITKETDMARDYGLSGQMQRAAVSIMSNIAEGFERGTSNEYHQFLVIAKASCGELRSQLYIAVDAGYIDQSQFRELYTLAEETSRVISGLRASIARRRDA
jgi:four helix bundle protein